ncbi:hypothetical protein [Pasteurella multocida]|uniref:hypothetical protein n=1 Tax=Pasteurella multocida TaxID=747 RepID=UPI00197E81B3|nr:hypothetical protein [Pasteurella multocida]
MIDQFLLQEARQAHKNGDYHAARDLYQQVAYSYNDFTELEKEAFTREVADFAGTDPMYHDILNLVISHISQSTEPVLQSQLTKVIKDGYGERGAELFRYVLYYADYRDELKRIKKGRSYQLLLPHQLPKDTSTEMLTPPKKAQRKRATTSITVPKTPRVRNVSTKPTSFIKEIKRGYRKGQKQANETSEILIGFVVIIGFFIWLFS